MQAKLANLIVHHSGRYAQFTSGGRDVAVMSLQSLLQNISFVMDQHGGKRTIAQPERGDISPSG